MGMAADFAVDLDQQLVECKTALQNQAEEMLTILVQFEERLKARLDAAEARLASLRSEAECLSANASHVPVVDNV